MKDNPKILMIAGEGESTNIMFHFLQHHFQLDNIIIEDSISPFVFVKKRINKLGLLKVIGQIIFQLTIVPFLKLESKKRIRQIIDGYGLSNKSIPENKILKTKSINSQHAIDLMKSLSPDFIIVSGCRILSSKTLKEVQSEFINIHAGITPQFRGVHGGYWAIHTGNKQDFGVTLHKIDAGIDTGEVISQKRLSFTNRDNFVSYPYLQLKEGLTLLKSYFDNEIVDSLISQDQNSALWHHPTLWGYLNHRWRKGVK